MLKEWMQTPLSSGLSILVLFVVNGMNNMWRAIGRVGGPGTFWEGFEYSLGTYRWYCFAYLRAWWHFRVENPLRIARIEEERTNHVEEKAN